MNKKQLIIAAMAAVLSVTGANATSDITGITGVGSNGYTGTIAKKTLTELKKVYIKNTLSPQSNYTRER